MRRKVGGQEPLPISDVVGERPSLQIAAVADATTTLALRVDGDDSRCEAPWQIAFPCTETGSRVTDDREQMVPQSDLPTVIAPLSREAVAPLLRARGMRKLQADFASKCKELTRGTLANPMPKATAIQRERSRVCLHTSSYDLVLLRDAVRAFGHKEVARLRKEFKTKHPQVLFTFSPDQKMARW